MGRLEDGEVFGARSASATLRREPNETAAKRFSLENKCFSECLQYRDDCAENAVQARDSNASTSRTYQHSSCISICISSAKQVRIICKQTSYVRLRKISVTGVECHRGEESASRLRTRDKTS